MFASVSAPVERALEEAVGAAHSGAGKKILQWLQDFSERV
jgi:hypothetical protein